MLYNAKCLVWALTGQKSFDQVVNLMNLTVTRKFLADVRRTKKILRKCTNDYYVNAQDKKELKQVESTLARSHLLYLLENDPELEALKQTRPDRPRVFLNSIEYSFGLIHQSIE